MPDPKGLIADVLNIASSTYNDVISEIASVITSKEEQAKEVHQGILDAIAANADMRNRAALRAAENAASQLQIERDVQAAKSKATADDITKVIENDVNQRAKELNDIATDAETVIRTGLHTEIDVTQETIRGIDKDIKSPLTEGIDSIKEAATDIWTAITNENPFQAITGTLSFLGEQFKEGFDSLGEKLGSRLALNPMNQLGDIDFSQDLLDRVNPILEEWEQTDDLPAMLKDMTHEGFLPAGLLGGMLGAGALMPLISTILQSIMQPWLMKNTQWHMSKAKPTILPLPDLLSLERSGQMERETVEYHAARLGYKDDDVKAIRRLTHRRPEIGLLLMAWHRGELDDHGLDHYLVAEQWGEREKALLKELSYQYPSVQDLVTMAVREVFTPAAVEKYQLEDDLPAAFTEWAGKIGLKPEIAKLYWMSHWRLVSQGAGERMLHYQLPYRFSENSDGFTLPSGAVSYNIIGEQDLAELYKAQDVMPFWRSRLQQISYRKLSRVDLRRFFNADTISPDELVVGYLSLGFSLDDAYRHLEFAEAQKKGKPQGDKNKERDFSRSSILKFYSEGLLLKPNALALLIKLGFSWQEAELIIERADLEIESDIRKDSINLIKDKYRVRDISYDEAQIDAGALNLTEGERIKLVRELESIRLSRITTPSRAELEGFFKEGLITADKFTSSMQGLGYNDFWIGIYQEKLDITEDEVITTKQLSSSQIITARNRGTITIGAALEMLVELGYSIVDASLLLDKPEVERDLTAAQIRSSVNKGRISRAVGLQRLLELNYSLTDANLLLDEPLEEDEEPVDPRLFTTSQIKRAYRDGFISEGDALFRLAALGYTRNDSLILLSEKEEDE